jgi:hypothetical protein
MNGVVRPGDGAVVGARESAFARDAMFRVETGHLTALGHQTKAFRRKSDLSIHSFLQRRDSRTSPTERRDCRNDANRTAQDTDTADRRPPDPDNA